MFFFETHINVCSFRLKSDFERNKRNIFIRVWHISKNRKTRKFPLGYQHLTFPFSVYLKTNGLLWWTLIPTYGCLLFFWSHSNQKWRKPKACRLFHFYCRLFSYEKPRSRILDFINNTLNTYTRQALHKHRIYLMDYKLATKFYLILIKSGVRVLNNLNLFHLRLLDLKLTKLQLSKQKR